MLQHISLILNVLAAIATIVAALISAYKAFKEKKHEKEMIKDIYDYIKGKKQSPIEEPKNIPDEKEKPLITEKVIAKDLRKMGGKAIYVSTVVTIISIIITLIITLYNIYVLDNRGHQTMIVLQDVNSSIQNKIAQGQIPSTAKPLSEISQGGQTQTALAMTVSKAPGAELQFMVTGKFTELPKNRRWWLGTVSGTLVWPQLDIQSYKAAGHEPPYRISAPQGVQSGELVLIDAGPEASAQFSKRRSDPLSDVPLFVPHLADCEIISLYRF